MISTLCRRARVSFPRPRYFVRLGIPPVRQISSKSYETPLTETVRTFLDPEEYYKLLEARGINFYCGVPDSLLRDFCSYVTDHASPHNHIMTANEGAAIGVASGYHLATGKFPVVYLQNSGLGNIINPILSLADPKVYSIPMVLMIGWRGEPGKRDEPQHMVQGKIMPNLLTDLHIPFEILPDYIGGAEEALQSCLHHLENRGGPYAFLVKRQTFSEYKLQTQTERPYSMSREEVLKLLIGELGEWDPIVSTTGFTSRELYELRDQLGQDHTREFLTVGSMGHSSAIALGIALAKPSKNVFCFDGDGALLMHLGTMATVGVSKVENFRHILLNNGAHDSVGGQPTGAFGIDFSAIASEVGYKVALRAKTPDEVIEGVRKLRTLPGPSFLEIRCNIGARLNLGRPKRTPIENKHDFMKFLEN